MGINTYFFDTYAFFELIEGNKNYEKFSENIGLVTTRLNLMELHYGLLLTKGKQIADRYFSLFSKFVVDFSDEDLKLANYFKAERKKQNLSYVDCLGYIVSKRMQIKFLTGDKQFKDLDNVEFVQ